MNSGYYVHQHNWFYKVDDTPNDDTTRTKVF